MNLYHISKDHEEPADLAEDGGSRLLAMHMPYTSLPEPIKAVDSKSKIVYVYRDPKDTLISFWQFFNKIRVKNPKPISLQIVYEKFCKGVNVGGLLWDHVLGYWHESLKRPEKVCCVKYEEMKKEPKLHLMKLAEFLGYPFSSDEEKQGIVDEIVKSVALEI